MRSKCAVPAEAWFNWVATARNRVSLISVDFPEPDTPVTQVNSPRGNSAVTFFKLLAVAPTTRRSLRHDAAAVHAGTGTQVDHVVRLADGILIVFHHDHRVAKVAQIDERIEQTLIVALMQADRRLVQDVHDADQPGSDLTGEAYALRLPA